MGVGSRVFVRKLRMIITRIDYEQRSQFPTPYVRHACAAFVHERYVLFRKHYFTFVHVMPSVEYVILVPLSQSPLPPATNLLLP